MQLLHAAFLIAALAAELVPPEMMGAQTDDATDAAESLAPLTIQAESVLTQLGIDGTIHARVKSADSLHQKAQRKGIRPDQVLDRLGLRLIVPDDAACYAVREALQARYPLVLGSDDDYIASPKDNGYQSLHFAAHTPLGVAEFQIRTPEMHAHAELGPAAHWRYKLGA